MTGRISNLIVNQNDIYKISNVWIFLLFMTNYYLRVIYFRHLGCCQKGEKQSEREREKRLDNGVHYIIGTYETFKKRDKNKTRKREHMAIVYSSLI